ncbi:hypothetical protein GV819_14135 [Pseudomonas sp. Fl5BN2]|uniref:hypothetical protein n=1 Tax=unclassified Pseudomonas TaxID=196821 RepID=UPI0013772D64|nr:MULTISPECIES: hypothetical protein [unclassified Pseudomonas]NBF03429.1 hypothetical protein [Pseudomonas sp. Fl5BN2]NBF10960.1 hypothetical protein [Pseudomonas sp. Fl4BN1]
MRLPSILLLSLSLGLSGCSYRVPDDAGETALIRIVAKGSVHGVPYSDCVDSSKPGSGLMVRPHRGIAHPNFRNLGIPMTAETDRVRRQEGFGANELKIPANRPFAFLYSNREEGMSRDYLAVCKQKVTFVPEAGATYQMEFFQDQMCTALLRKIDEHGAKLPEPVALHSTDFCNANARHYGQ